MSIHATAAAHPTLAKFVPTGPALTAVSRAMWGDPATGASPTLTDAAEHEAFSRWYNTSGQIGRYQVDLAEVDDILATVPDDAAGRIWSAALREAAEATETDAYRPFDRVRFTIETPQVAALFDFAAVLRKASPLLAPVAEAIEEFAPGFLTPLGDLADLLTGSLTTQGIRVPDTLLASSTHDDDDEDGYWSGDEPADAHTLIEWSHIDALLTAASRSAKRTWTAPAAGSYVHLFGLVSDLLAILPPVADSDQGAARGLRAED